MCFCVCFIVLYRVGMVWLIMVPSEPISLGLAIGELWIENLERTGPCSKFCPYETCFWKRWWMDGWILPTCPMGISDCQCLFMQASSSISPANLMNSIWTWVRLVTCSTLPKQQQDVSWPTKPWNPSTSNCWEFFWRNCPPNLWFKCWWVLGRYWI